MHISSQRVISVAATVEELYVTCKQQLEKEYGKVEMTIRGSSVARVFSQEKAADLDLQATLRFSHLRDIPSMTREGYGLRWKLLEGIRDLVLKKIPEEHHETVRAISLDAFDFKDTNTLMANKGEGPCNIHQVQVGELEISCFVVADPSRPMQRTFDFNSGALAISIDDRGQVHLQSPLDNLEETIQQISVKELSCIRPREISRRGVSRYLNKIIFSGYVDPSAELFSELVVAFRGQVKKETPQEIAHELLKELQNVFKDKKSPLWLLYLALVVENDKDPMVQELLTLIKPSLCDMLGRSQDPIDLQIKNCIEHQRFNEIAWLFVLKASVLEVKIHKGKPHLQLALSEPYPYYVLMPVEVLSQKDQPIDVKALWQLPIMSLGHQLSEQTKELFQKSLSKQTKDPAFFPIFFLLAKKFSFKMQPAFGNMFWSWLKQLPEHEKNMLDWEMILPILPMFEEDASLGIQEMTVFLNAVAKNLLRSKDGLFDPALNPRYIMSMCQQLVKLEEAKHADLHQIMLLMQRYVHEFFSQRPKEDKASDFLAKTISNFCVILYRQGMCLEEDLIKSAQICFEKNYVKEGFKRLQILLRKPTPAAHDLVSKLLATWSQNDPVRLLEFLETAAQDVQHAPAMVLRLVETAHETMFKYYTQAQLQRYCDVIISIAGQDLALQIARQHQRHALHGCPKSLQMMEYLLKLTGCSVDKVLDFETMDHKDLKQALAFISDHSGEFIDGVVLAKLIATGFRLKEIDCAKLHLDKLIQLNPNLAVEVLKDQHLEQIPLIPILETMLQLHRQHNWEILDQSFAYRILDAIQSRLGNAEQDKLVAKEAQLLKEFHKIAILQNLEHPVWNQVWSILLNQSETHHLDQWFNPSDILDNLERIPFQALQPILNRVEIPFDFIEKYAEKLCVLLEEEAEKPHSNLQSMLFNFIERTAGDFWALDPRLYRSNEQALKIFRSFNAYLFEYKPTQEEQEDRLNLFFTALKGMALFGSKTARYEEVLSMFVTFMDEQGGEFQDFFDKSGRHHLVLLSLLHKSIIDKDLENFEHYYYVYRQHCSPDITKKSLLRQESCCIDLPVKSFDSICREAGKILEAALLASNGALAKQEAALMHFYNHFLADVLLALEEGLDAAEADAEKKSIKALRDRVLGYVKDHIERVSRLSAAASVDAFPELLKYRKILSKHTKHEITKKLLKVTTDLLRKTRAIRSVEEKALLSGLIHDIQLTPETLTELASINQQEILEFLELLRPFLFIKSALSLANASTVFLVKSLEAFLTSEISEQYVTRWVRSIIANKETVTIEELNCLAIYNMKLDARFTAIFEGDPFQQVFARKKFSFPKFFEKKHSIEAYLQLFQITFSRFSEDLPETAFYESPEKLSIFSLFSVMSPHLRKAIASMRQDKEKVALLSMFLDAILPQLQGKANFATKSVLAVAWNCLLCMDKTGHPRFRFLEKTQASRNFIVFYHLNRLLSQVPEKYKADMGFDKEALKEIFAANKERCAQYLSQDQVTDITCCLYGKGLPSRPAAAAEAAALDLSSLQLQDPQEPEGMFHRASGYFSRVLSHLLPLTSPDVNPGAAPGTVHTQEDDVLQQFHLFKLSSED